MAAPVPDETHRCPVCGQVRIPASVSACPVCDASLWAEMCRRQAQPCIG